jgi:chloramphenicol O-acetyltransferase
MTKMVKQGNASKGSKVGSNKKLETPTKKKVVPAKKGWEWAPFTLKSVAFTAAARKLSELLTQTYGDNVTISSFEKMIAAFPSMTDERKALIHMDQETVEAYEDYRKAREVRDTERETFRGDIAVADVEGGLAAIKAAASAMSTGG